ncbi:MAG TPA: TrmJ/YjtD family RNA methyltransferase [Acidobacteriaceae bacterium]|nr:TrmJ/YjtD family RNA methyltransferase [Acidobacteriaceae bacterium]
MPGSIDPDRLCIILVSTRNPLNIGAAARAMCNFGFHHLRLVQPYDPAFREARSAVGASSVLTDAKAFSALAEAVADCTLVVGTTAIRHRQLQHPLHLLKDGAPLILQELAAPPDHPSRVAILFGSEKVGLSNEDLSHCHWLMHIPTGDEQKSMNLGQAVAVCLYELARNSTAPFPITDKPRTSAEEVERLTAVLIETLRSSNYMDAQSAGSKEEDIRRMLRRMQLSSEDVTTWLGMLRQILWRLGAKS